jgi:cell division protein DivIC
MRKILAIGLLIFELYLIINLSRSIIDLWDKQGEVKKTADHIEELRMKNKQLESQLSYVQTKEFAEREARDKLGLVRPGETVVVIPQNVLQAASAAAEPVPVVPNWMQWWRLFAY